MKVKCDRCKKRYGLEEPDEREINDEVTEVYFVCPECGAEFHSFYKNSKVNKLIEKNKKHQNDLQDVDDDNKRNLILSKIRGNKHLIKKEQERIEESIEK